jgi:hypothetical protein
LVSIIKNTKLFASTPSTCTVAGLEYTYTYSSQTLIISKTSGTFTAEDVAKVVESIKLKNTDTDSQL